MLFCLNPIILEIALVLGTTEVMTEGIIAYKKEKYKRRYAKIYKCSKQEMEQKISESKEVVKELEKETQFFETMLKTYKLQWDNIKLREEKQDVNKQCSKKKKWRVRY